MIFKFHPGNIFRKIKCFSTEMRLLLLTFKLVKLLKAKESVTDNDRHDILGLDTLPFSIFYIKLFYTFLHTT